MGGNTDEDRARIADRLEPMGFRLRWPVRPRQGVSRNDVGPIKPRGGYFIVYQYTGQRAGTSLTAPFIPRQA